MDLYLHITDIMVDHYLKKKDIIASFAGQPLPVNNVLIS